MVKFEKLTGKFILSAMMIVSILSFIVITQSANNASDPIINQDIFSDSFSGLISEIENGTESANEKFGVFNSEQPKPGFGSIVLFGIVSVGKAFSQIITGFLTAIVKLPLAVLGIPPNIYNLVITWLIIALIVGAWLLYKLGG